MNLDQMPENEAATLVETCFTEVDAEWWWQRAADGGVTISQTLDPERLVSQIVEASGRYPYEIRQIALKTMGVEELEPSVLSFSIPGDTTVDEAADYLTFWSATPYGLAESIYRQLIAALRKELNESRC